MSLLEDIQHSAVDARTDLGEILRKCKVLGARLGSEPFENWLIWESGGYPTGVDLPKYREWGLEIKGTFSGPFQSVIRNAPIATHFIPEAARERFKLYRCRQSVASVERLLIEANGHPIQVSTGDLVNFLSTRVYDGYNCVECFAIFAPGNLTELLKTVRNRVLDFALAIWKEDPKAGDIDTSANKLRPSEVTQIFNTINYGGVTNVVGSVADSTIDIEIRANDFEALERYLTNTGVEPRDVADLKDAIQKDGPPPSAASYGANVAQWISKMTQKAASGAWKVGLAAAGKILAEVLGKYYGFPH